MSLGLFPAPYSDELLYSICARYSERVRYPNNRALCKELFGSQNATAVIDFPTRLESLLKAIPPNNYYSLETILNNHTLLPFYAPFLDKEVVKKSRKQMAKFRGNGIYHRIGVIASRVRSSDWLRFCPLCSAEDIKMYGETYWRRLHQLPGVLVCSRHDIYLINSSIRTQTSPHQHRFFSANESIPNLSCFEKLENSDSDKILLKVADQSRQLLTCRYPSITNGILKEKYEVLLYRKTFATLTGSLHAEKLVTEFLNFYSLSLLSKLGCELTGSDLLKSNWMLRLLRKQYSNSQHPLHHILLLIFLETDVDKFFNSIEEITLFGPPPWLCLNPAATHYKQSVVSNLELGNRSRNGKRAGIFKCECGFKFIRSGPDTISEDKYRIDKMIDFGTIWESELIKLWKNPNLNLSQIARYLCVDPLTIKRHVIRLNLSLERATKLIKKPKSELILKGNKLKEEFESTLAKKQSMWLTLLSNLPTLSYKELRQQNNRLYSWLNYNAPLWLKQNRPIDIKKKAITSHLDWTTRDIQLAAEVKLAAQNLLEQSGRPVQITKSAIGKKAKCMALLSTKLPKLPETQKVLESVIETREEYAVRRIKFAAEIYRHSNTLPSRWELIISSSVYALRDRPLIAQSLDSELLLLGKQIKNRLV